MKYTIHIKKKNKKKKKEKKKSGTSYVHILWFFHPLIRSNHSHKEMIVISRFEMEVRSNKQSSQISLHNVSGNKDKERQG